MAKESMEEENDLNVKFSKGKGSENSINKENGTVDERKKAKQRSTKGGEDEKDEVDEGVTETEDGGDGEESVVIPLEEDATTDAPDGKNAKKESNTYAAKKTVAQGMMDIALITANANQLRFMLEYNRDSSTFFVNVILIVISLFLQVGVGISLIFKGRLDMKGQSKHRNAKRINNYVVVGVFLVTIINVFIASFTITGGTTAGKNDNSVKND